jgi:hypothetical protein
MKTINVMMMTLMMCLVSSGSFCQADSIYLVKEVDDMSGKSYVYTNRDIVVSNEDATIGFRLDAILEPDFTIGSVFVTMVGMGDCNENDEMIILFANGEKITRKSWKKFNCDGEAYFNITQDEYQLLRTQPMSKIRITNGRTFDSYTGNVKSKDKRFFIQLFYSLDHQLVTAKK